MQWHKMDVGDKPVPVKALSTLNIYWCGEILPQPSIVFLLFCHVGFFVIYLVKRSSEMFTQSDVGLKLQQVGDFWFRKSVSTRCIADIKLIWNEVPQLHLACCCREGFHIPVLYYGGSSVCVSHDAKSKKRYVHIMTLLWKKAQK